MVTIILPVRLLCGEVVHSICMRTFSLSTIKAQPPTRDRCSRNIVSCRLKRALALAHCRRLVGTRWDTRVLSLHHRPCAFVCTRREEDIRNTGGDTPDAVSLPAFDSPEFRLFPPSEPFSTGSSAAGSDPDLGPSIISGASLKGVRRVPVV